jgi:hypothetical protein
MCRYYFAPTLTQSHQDNLTSLGQALPKNQDSASQDSPSLFNLEEKDSIVLEAVDDLELLGLVFQQYLDI